MKRLTKRNPYGEGFVPDHENCPMRGKCNDSADCVAVLVDRLAAYEESASSNAGLLPCPWCGETAKRQIIRPGMNGRFFIDHFDAVFHLQSSIGFDSEDEAIAAWNAQHKLHETEEKKC